VSFDSDELSAVVDDESGSDLSMKQVMLFLTQLVSQTMTHLLRSEIEVKSYRDKYDELSRKVEQLSVDTNAISPIPMHGRKPSSEKDIGSFRLHPGDFSTFYCDNTRDPSNESTVLAEEYLSKFSTYEDDEEQHIGDELEDSSALLQHSLMNGSSASDWLFAAQAQYRSPARYDARGGSF
jgi:hypothetical protein